MSRKQRRLWARGYVRRTKEPGGLFRAGAGGKRRGGDQRLVESTRRHEGHLRGKGKTFAVLGCGVDILSCRTELPLMRRMKTEAVSS